MIAEVECYLLGRIRGFFLRENAPRDPPVRFRCSFGALGSPEGARVLWPDST
jgi:hypothetical protein